MHAIVLRFFSVVVQSGNREKSDAMIGVIVGRPRRGLVLELHLRANNQAIPPDHLIEAAGFYRDVMQLGLDHRMSSRSCRVFFNSVAAEGSAAVLLGSLANPKPGVSVN
jgi:hypothetical protein